MPGLTMPTVIPLERIVVRSDRLRTVDAAAAERLAASILENGLLSPITVRRVGQAFEVVAGAHRVAAVRAIGAVDIAALVVDLDDMGAQMAEIDENLIRDDLDDLERAEYLAARKRLYLVRHPETRHGAMGGGRNGVGTKQRTENGVLPFSVDTAERTGLSTTTIERDVRVGEALAEEVRKRLRGTPVARSKQALQALAALEPEAQITVVDTADVANPVAVKIAAVAAAAPSRLPRRRRVSGPRAVVAPRPEPAARFAYSLGVFHRFLELDPDVVVGLLTEQEVSGFRTIAPVLEQRLRVWMTRLLEGAAS